ncbi:MAG: SPOR domain-containing protein [Pseudomonadota bacterium]
MTALKRAEPPAPEPAAADDAAPETEPVRTAEDASSDTEDAIAGASAAIARAEAGETTPAQASTGVTAEASAVAEAEANETEPAPRTARRGFLAGLFGSRAAGAPLSATGAASAGDATTAALESPEVTTVALDAPEAAAEAAPEPVIATEALPSAAAQEAALTDPEIVAPATEAPRQRKGFLGGLFAPRSNAPLSAIDPSLTSGTPTPENQSPAPATRGAYLEVGVFPTRNDADEAAASMRAAGVIPLIDERETADASAWRVLVGPATSLEDRKALLHKVKGLGYEDASIVRR